MLVSVGARSQEVSLRCGLISPQETGRTPQACSQILLCQHPAGQLDPNSNSNLSRSDCCFESAFRRLQRLANGQRTEGLVPGRQLLAVLKVARCQRLPACPRRRVLLHEQRRAVAFQGRPVAAGNIAAQSVLSGVWTSSRRLPVYQYKRSRLRYELCQLVQPFEIGTRALSMIRCSLAFIVVALSRGYEYGKTEGQALCFHSAAGSGAGSRPEGCVFSTE